MLNFWGGTKINNIPHEGKNQTENVELRKIDPAQVIIRMKQHIGAPCVPIVGAGQIVALGQLIAETGVNLPINIHSSVSGKIVEVNENYIKIDNDFKNTLDEGILPRRLVDKISSEEIKRIVARAGIVGLGGAGFPSGLKLDTDKKITTVIINGCECEPYLTTDDYTMLHYVDDIMLGAVLIQKAVGADDIIIAIEDNKLESINEMKLKALSYSKVSVESLETIYPQGGEKQIIQALTGQEVPDGGLPMDLGLVVFNVSTAKAIYNAIYHDMPLINRIVTVCGDVESPGNVLAPIGTKISDLIDFCGGFSGTPSKVIEGGPMMGKEILDIESGIVKTTGGIFTINQNNDIYSDTYIQESQCIRCGKCSDACPIALDPKRIDAFYIAGDIKRCEKLMATSCINCGCCSYVCPAYRDLAYRIVAAKDNINMLRKAAAK